MSLSAMFFALWFFLPAGLANMFPIFAAHTPVLKKWGYPLDFYFHFRGRRLLGSNKTVRGLLVAIITGIVTVWIQEIIFGHWSFLQRISPINYSEINPLILGFLLGFGAIGGDALESFFKRQINIPEGESWFFFDQMDYILGGLILSYLYLPMELKYYVLIILFFFVLHLISSGVGFLLGLKQKPI